MSATTNQTSKQVWIGWILTGLASAMFVMSASMKLLHGEQVVQGMIHFGFQDSMILPLAILELTCLAIYLIPVTSVLGAVLLTGYLGGAVCTHWRAGESFLPPLIVGFAVWGGLYLREKRLHALLPLRSKV